MDIINTNIEGVLIIETPLFRDALYYVSVIVYKSSDIECVGVENFGIYKG